MKQRNKLLLASTIYGVICAIFTILAIYLIHQNAKHTVDLLFIDVLKFVFAGELICIILNFLVWRFGWNWMIVVTVFLLLILTVMSGVSLPINAGLLLVWMVLIVIGIAYESNLEEGI